jgi:hypothetical protein
MKVGDIIDGRKVTKVFELCGGIAYQSVPVAETKTEVKTEEEAETKPKKRIRRKKEQ